MEEPPAPPMAAWRESFRFLVLPARAQSEQLFAVCWSACYLSVLKIVAARMNIKLPPDVAVDAEVDLGKTAGAYFLPRYRA